jgi:hypothetical protein
LSEINYVNRNIFITFLQYFMEPNLFLLLNNAILYFFSKPGKGNFYYFSTTRTYHPHLLKVFKSPVSNWLEKINSSTSQFNLYLYLYSASKYMIHVYRHKATNKQNKESVIFLTASWFNRITAPILRTRGKTMLPNPLWYYSQDVCERNMFPYIMNLQYTTKLFWFGRVYRMILIIETDCLSQIPSWLLGLINAQQ